MDNVVQGCLASMEAHDVDLKLVEYDQCVFHLHCLHKIVFRANNGDIYLFCGDEVCE